MKVSFDEAAAAVGVGEGRDRCEIKSSTRLTTYYQAEKLWKKPLQLELVISSLSHESVNPGDEV